MLERRRKARYGSLSEGGAPEDVELGVNHAGEGSREGGAGGELGPQESGVMNLEQEVDNWDENAVDNWDSDDGTDNAPHAHAQVPPDPPAEHDDHMHPPPPYVEDPGQKKRSD